MTSGRLHVCVGISQDLLLHHLVLGLQLLDLLLQGLAQLLRCYLLWYGVLLLTLVAIVHHDYACFFLLLLVSTYNAIGLKDLCQLLSVEATKRDGLTTTASGHGLACSLASW